MAYQPRTDLLGKIGGEGSNYSQSAAQMMQNAQQAMGSQKPVRVEQEPGLGGALQAGLGGALSMAGTGAAMTSAGITGALPGLLASGPGMLIGAGVGILSTLFG